MTAVWKPIVAALFLTLVSGSAAAVTVPFTEEFSTDVAGWEDNENNPLAFNAAGGPDGSSYATSTFNFFGFVEPFPGAGPILYRAQDEDNASGGAFIGDWIAAGVTQVSVFVRHSASQALNFGMRVANTVNFPAAFIDSADGLVQPNVWTEVIFDTDPNNPLCTPESFGPGFTCAGALVNVAHLQFGTDAPAGLDLIDADILFDIDKVSLIAAAPEPTTGLLALGGLAGLAFAGRRRS